MNRLKSIAVLLGAALVSSCGNDALQNITAPAPGAKIRFFNFGVCGASPTATTSCMPGVNFYADNTKLTAISSTTGSESTLGTAYGAVGNGGFYSGIAPGQYTFSGRIAATTDKDLPVANVPAPLADGKYYSLYLSGFYDATTRTVDAFVVEDPFVQQIDFTVAYVRFVNASPNSSPMTLFARLVALNIEGPVGSDVPVAYKGATEFEAMPPAVYDLSARTAGSSTNVISRTGVSFVAGKVYTVGARGDITITSATAINRPILDNTANR